MPATGAAYPEFAATLANEEVDLTADTLKVLLFSSYTYAASHKYVSDVKSAGTEASSGVYTTGGHTLASVTFTRSGNVYTLDAADLSIHASTGTDAAFAVIADTTPGSDATNPVIGYINLDGSGGTVSVLGFTWNASGILTITAS